MRKESENLTAPLRTLECRDEENREGEEKGKVGDGMRMRMKDERAHIGCASHPA